MVIDAARVGPARRDPVPPPGRDDPRIRPARPPARRSAVRRFVPPQHGAWAMLLVPYLTALLCVDASWVHAPLLVAWLGGYLLSYYALLAVKTRRPGRVRAQMAGYAAITLPTALVVLAVRPAVLVVAPAFAVLVGVNVLAARSRTERSLLNDAASVLLGCLMVPVVGLVAGAGALDLWRPFVAVLLYFAGTVPYVKTMIRNRGDGRYLRASVAYHVLSTALAAVVAWPLGVLFAGYLARAVLLPRRRLAPLRVGLVEIAASAALMITVPLTLA